MADYKKSCVVSAVVLGLCLLTTVSGAAYPLLGVSPNLPAGGTREKLKQDIAMEHTMGLNLMYISYKWSELEPLPKVYDFAKLEETLKPLKEQGFHVCLTLQMIDTGRRSLPKDLRDTPYDSPVMHDRFHQLLAYLGPKLDSSVNYVVLGNKADVYLADHSDELEAFAKLAEEGRRYLKKQSPKREVGISTTYDGYVSNPYLSQRLNRSMDVVSFAYYPLDDRYHVKSIAQVRRDFATMLLAANDKPLALQETGYPTATTLESSEAQQARFVNAIFEMMKKHSDKIGFVNFFMLYDFNSKYLDKLTSMQAVPDDRYRTFLATIGLKRADGTSRPAWDQFQQQTKQWAQNKP